VGRSRTASAIYRRLQPYPARVLAVAWTVTDSKRVRRRLSRYHTTWRLIEPELGGEDLKALGLRPGPLFSRLLEGVRDARLDGTVTTRAEEEALVRQMVAEDE
jgi:tRNA nucleotidyltransferase (CCA-adding enzyme)